MAEKKEKKIKKEMKETIYQKILKLQNKVGSLKKSSKAYNYMYTDLLEIHKNIKPILCGLGLVVIHNIIDDVLITYVVNVENKDEVIESRINLNSSGLTAQELGSKITYYRRYNLLCLLDITTEDDDGLKASSKSGNYKTEINGGTFKNDVKSIVDEIRVCKDKNRLKEIGETLEKNINPTPKQKQWIIVEIKKQVEYLNKQK